MSLQPQACCPVLDSAPVLCVKLATTQFSEPVSWLGSGKPPGRYTPQLRQPPPLPAATAQDLGVEVGTCGKQAPASAPGLLRCRASLCSLPGLGRSMSSQLKRGQMVALRPIQ
jgi:hypothetical protein